MRPTHNFVVYPDHICALGNDNYFSWIIEKEFDEWDLSTIYGGRVGEFKTFKEVLNQIGYKRSIYERI